MDLWMVPYTGYLLFSYSFILLLKFFLKRELPRAVLACLFYELTKICAWNMQVREEFPHRVDVMLICDEVTNHHHQSISKFYMQKRILI